MSVTPGHFTFGAGWCRERSWSALLIVLINVLRCVFIFVLVFSAADCSRTLIFYQQKTAYMSKYISCRHMHFLQMQIEQTCPCREYAHLLPMLEVQQHDHMEHSKHMNENRLGLWIHSLPVMHKWKVGEWEWLVQETYPLPRKALQNDVTELTIMGYHHSKPCMLWGLNFSLPTINLISCSKLDAIGITIWLSSQKYWWFHYIQMVQFHRSTKA